MEFRLTQGVQNRQRFLVAGFIAKAQMVVDGVQCGTATFWGLRDNLAEEMPMRLVLPTHVVAAALVLVSGFVALSAMKGARLHRRSGMLFVNASIAMCVTGTVMTIAKGDTMNAVTAPPAGGLTWGFTGLRSGRRGWPRMARRAQVGPRETSTA